MSDENVEVVREAWSAYGEQGIDAALEYFAEDCVCEDFPELPDRATYRGRVGWRQRDGRFRRPWADLVLEPAEFIDAGGEVVVVATMPGHGEGSDVPMQTTFAFVTKCATGASFGIAPSHPGARPSKPPGCGSSALGDEQ
jgi:ketosteroid isomerase-like protein